MGFFDKLKGAVNAVTGGAAKVTIEYQPQVAFAGDVVSVRITAVSTGAELKSQGAFVDLSAAEEVKIGGKENPSGQDIHMHKSTFDQAFQIAPAFVLAPNETKLFEGKFTVPATLQPSYQGPHAHHAVHIRGRIEAFGNDPDSGFLPLRVGIKS